MGSIVRSLLVGAGATAVGAMEVFSDWVEEQVRAAGASCLESCRSGAIVSNLEENSRRLDSRPSSRIGGLSFLKGLCKTGPR